MSDFVYKFIVSFGFTLFACMTVYVLISMFACYQQALPPPMPPVSNDGCLPLQAKFDSMDCGIDVKTTCVSYAQQGHFMPKCAMSALTCEEALTCQ
jgi:hypothetical protein